MPARPIPITPEVIALAIQGLDEEEILAELREVESGGGYKFEDFIGELEELARRAGTSTADKG